MVGLTGSILVFQDEIDTALNKELFEVLKGQKRYSIGEIVTLVKEKHPDKPFDYVFATNNNNNPNSTYRFYNFTTEEEFFIDPYTGNLCGKRLINSAFIRVVMNIHRTLLIPAAGRYIVGLSTLCMLILTISGLRLWVPQQYRKWKQWKSVLTVNFKAGWKRQNYDWHNVLGLYSAPVVIMLSITGFAITFSTVFIAFLFMLTGKSPQSVADIFGQKSEYVEGKAGLPATEAEAVAYRLMPQAQLLGIAIPTTQDMVYRLDLKAEGRSKEGKRVMLLMDQYSGKITLNSETDFPNIGHSYLSWLVSLHYGSFGGMPTRILAFIGGLIPLLLFITGFIIWWPRHKKQKGRALPIPPKPNRNDLERAAVTQLPFIAFFGFYFRKGLKYAGILMVAAFLSGALYGVISGIVWQPALFAVLYTGISICVNAIVALLVGLFNLLFLAPFGKSSRPVIRYFSLSFSFLLVFLPVIIAIALWSRQVF